MNVNLNNDVKKNTQQDYVQFIFFGRLAKEKGRDLLIDARTKIIANPDLTSKTRFLVCGDGPYRPQVLSLANKSESISYLGRKPRDQLQRFIAASDYTIYPSLFLETFGLTALESLSLGVPVIGYQKGGLVPFIFDELAINKQKGKDKSEKLYNLLVNLIKKTNLQKKQEDCERASKISAKYSIKKRMKNFHSVIHKEHKQKKILLISDYSTKLYGIETHLLSLKDILEDHGYQVELYGRPIKKDGLTKFKRILGLPATIGNFRAAWQIKKMIRKQQPDIIRRHSTSRWLGWLPLFSTKKYKGQQRMTYHDLGYFHPYPHSVYEVDQLPAWDLKSYLKAGNTKNPIKLLAMFAKFILIGLLRIQLKQNIDKHFVPSHYLLSITQRRLGHQPKGKVMLLEHFLRET